MIFIEGVTHSYRPEAPALQSVTLHLRRGEVTVLLGPSGAGKSTLLRCLNGLVRPDSGTVRVEGLGDPRTDRLRREHRRQTGMIFQSHEQIGRQSALTNVLKGRLRYHSTLRSLFPLSGPEVRLALQCLERVGLLGHAQSRVGPRSSARLHPADNA